MDFKGSTHTDGHINGITKVSVSDFGKGIAPNNKTSGLGLGLYISAAIIRLHGGDLGVKSEIDNKEDLLVYDS